MNKSLLLPGFLLIITLGCCSSAFLIFSSFFWYQKLIGLLLIHVTEFILCIFLIKLQVTVTKAKKTVRTIGFLHLNADQFGGGEKVLWQILDVVAGEAYKFPNTEIVIYCAPSQKFHDFRSLFKRAQEVFAYPFPNIESNQNIRLCQIPMLRTVYNTRDWPMTLLSMAFSSYIAGIICSLENPPHIVIDTAGYPVAFPAFSFFAKSHICAYIHYPFAYCLQRQLYKHVAPPTERVPQAGMPDKSLQTPAEEHPPRLSLKKRLRRSVILWLRTRYYTLVQRLYYNALRYCGLMWVNSSWTKARHVEVIEELERQKGLLPKLPASSSSSSSIPHSALADSIRVLYPPCDSEQFLIQLQSQWKQNGFDIPMFPSAGNEDTSTSDSSSSSSHFLSDTPSVVPTSFAPYLVPPRTSVLSNNTAPSVASQIQFIKENWHLPAKCDHRNPVIVTVGQFRPEKEHEKQIQTFTALYAKHPELKPTSDSSPSADNSPIKLVMCGGTVKGLDAYFNKIQKMIHDNHLDDVIEIRTNVPGTELRNLMTSSMGAMHTMFEEHFGIVIVEMMASGAVPICNPSGGMFDDVFNPEITPSLKPGFVARTPDEYADRIYDLYQLWKKYYNGDDENYRQIQIAGYAESLRFSIESFRCICQAEIHPLIETALEGSTKAKVKQL